MFNDIPESIKKRMKYLEELDARHREQGLERDVRLRQIPPSSGKFLALLAVGSPQGTWLEIGTSGGYSTLWLSLAARARKQKLVTLEWLEAKFKLAGETFSEAGVTDVVESVRGDARELVKNYRSLSFCFLDIEKEMYLECLDSIIENLVPGGILAADNVISHRNDLEEFVEKASNDRQLDTLVVPIDRGILVARKI